MTSQLGRLSAFIIKACVIAFCIEVNACISKIAFNKHMVYTTCYKYYTVKMQLISQYNVVQNTKPENATCWEEKIIATFADEICAKRYAATFTSFYFDCYTSPKDKCNYYTSPKDTTTDMYMMFVTTIICSMFAILYISFKEI